MTSMTRQYSVAASHARTAAEKTADYWTQGARTVTDLLPGLPRVDLVPAVERYFELVQQMVDINRHLAVRWAEAVGTLSGVVREKAGSAGDLCSVRLGDGTGDVERGQDREDEGLQELHEELQAADEDEESRNESGSLHAFQS